MGDMNLTNCTVPYCDQNPHAKGICFTHYMQVYRGRTPGPIRVRDNNPPDTCTVPGCERSYTARGMCMMHYQRRRRARRTRLTDPKKPT